MFMHINSRSRFCIKTNNELSETMTVKPNTSEKNAPEILCQLILENHTTD